MLKLRPKSVTAHSFPNIAQLQNWKSALARNLVAASVVSPMDRKEVQWLNETEGKTFEQLSDSGEERFHHLDALLAEALMKVPPKGLMMRVQQMENAALKSNTCITGRQVLHMVYDWLRTDAHMSLVYGHADLMEIPWMGAVLRACRSS